MAKFRWICENYKIVADELQLTLFTSPSSSRQAYNEDIAKDLANRDTNANFYEPIANIRRHLADNSTLQDDELSYAQGNFTGKVFSSWLHGAFTQERKLIPAECIGFTYVNDANHYCGFSIQPCFDGINYAETEQSKYMYVITHISNVEKPLESREVNVIMSNDVMPETIDDRQFNKEFGKPLEAHDISQQLRDMLKSGAVAQLLSGLIDKQGALNLAKFNEIKQRLEKLSSIDDREKKMEIWGKIIFWAKLKQNSLTPTETKDFEASLTKMLTQQDYFQTHTKEELGKYLEFFQKEGTFSDLLPLESQEKQFIDSVMTEIYRFLQEDKRPYDAEKFKVLNLYGYSSEQEWQEEKKLNFFSRNPQFTKALILTFAAGLTLAGLAASGVLMFPVAIALAVVLVGLCSWLAKKIYECHLKYKDVEQKMVDIEKKHLIEEKTKQVIQTVMADKENILTPSRTYSFGLFASASEVPDGVNLPGSVL